MVNQLTKIAISETGQFSKLMQNYVAGEEPLRDFYKYAPNIASFSEAIDENKIQNINRELLVTALKEQYKKSSIKDADSVIDLLLDEKIFTVCTGHQLCVFTGPLYFVYKIITTINLAEALKKKHPESNFVPVYWMASEDHDYDEIKSIHLFGKTLEWNNDEAAGAVGRLDTSSLKPVIDELQQVLGDAPNATELIDLFRNAYLKQGNLANATRHLVHHLFAAYGLLIIDGDSPMLKAEFSEIVKDDILSNTNYELIENTIKQLSEIGVKPQVSPRKINCFYMKGNLRERIVLEGELYKVLNSEISFSEVELLTELENHPERFSPNVVTRPLYQQKILPNLAYVGGPGEIAYWLEFKAMFDHHKINFPVLVPRNFVTLVDGRAVAKIEKLGFEIQDIFKPEEVLIKEYVNKNSASDLSLKAQEEKLNAVYAEISSVAIGVDKSLKASVDAEMKKANNALKNIESKMLRSEKQKQETSINQIKKNKANFFPEGMLQERYDNIAPYYLKSGKQLIADLKNNFDPFDVKMMLIEL